jgi:hypothetical protein
MARDERHFISHGVALSPSRNESRKSGTARVIDLRAVPVYGCRHMIPACDQRLGLLVEYQNLMQAYAEAIGRLAVKYISQAEHQHLSEAADKARQDSVAARERRGLSEILERRTGPAKLL